MSTNNKLNDNKDINNYQKKGFIKRLPYGVKATFIKYWFYGALYFFCFMGLGLVLANETLIIVTGLIGGVLFDIATYNIILLFAESREEASKWWFFKSKKVYSILINIVVITGMFFAFYFIVVPIRKAIGDTWLFGEPLSSALILITLDTAICWLKNLIVMGCKKVFKLNKKDANQAEAYIRILDVSPVSVTFEVNSKGNYYASNPYNVLLDNEIILKKVKTNVLTIFDLKPDTKYRLTINRQTVSFVTSKISKFYRVYEGNDIQKVIDIADKYSLIIVNSGNYKIKSLSLKDDLVIYLRKGARLIPSNDINDYPILPPYYPSKDKEIYGNYEGMPYKMRQSIFHIDHLNKIKIIGEGTIDGEYLSSLYSKNSKEDIAPPYLAFINHSSQISFIGVEFKSFLPLMNCFFSDNIDLLDIKVNSSNEDGIISRCSSNINIFGCNFSSCKESISIKSKNINLDNVFTNSKSTTIKNCLFENSSNGVVIGSDIASGINDINISRSLFNNLKAGILVKTNIKNGKDGIIKDVNVNDINMDNVLTPIIINMYYESEENISKKKSIAGNKNVPYLNNFIFNKITVKDYELAAGIFIGLNEKYIGEIKISDSSFIPKENCIEDTPISLNDNYKYSKNGFIVKNVRLFTLNKVEVKNFVGKKIDIENAGEVSDV